LALKSAMTPRFISSSSSSFMTPFPDSRHARPGAPAGHHLTVAVPGGHSPAEMPSAAARSSRSPSTALAPSDVRSDRRWPSALISAVSLPLTTRATSGVIWAPGAAGGRRGQQRPRQVVPGLLPERAANAEAAGSPRLGQHRLVTPAPLDRCAVLTEDTHAGQPLHRFTGSIRRYHLCRIPRKTGSEGGRQKRAISAPRWGPARPHAGPASGAEETGPGAIPEPRAVPAQRTS